MAMIVIFDDGEEPFETSDPAQYGLSLRFFGTSFFPEKIPENAKSSYHLYRYEAYIDEFLELQFETTEELNSFLEKTFSNIESDKIVKRTNPYNDSFTEYFKSDAQPSITGYDKKLYYIRVNDSIHRTWACFHSMNVSVEEKMWS